MRWFFTALLATLPISLSTSTVSAAELNPMAVGKTWAYKVESIGHNTYCPVGERTQEISEIVSIDNFSAFKIKGYCGYVGYSRIEDRKTYTWFQQENSWYLEFDTAEDNRVWYEFRAQAQWTYIGNWIHNDLTFFRCYKKTRILRYTHVSVHCDGIGQVFTEMIDMGGNGWRANLIRW